MFYGVITPFITPFKKDFSIDFKAVELLAKHQIEHGVHGIFPNSTTGEFVHLKPDEAVELTRHVIDAVGGKAWVIPGISGNCTEHCIELGRRMIDLGIDGVVVTPPFFFKPGLSKLEKHFSSIADKLDTNIIVYNIPATTGICIPVKLYVKLAIEHSNIVAAKVTMDSIDYMRRLILDVKSVRRDFSVLTGVDAMLLPVLMMGGDGGIMALANILPQIHREVYDSFVNGDLSAAVRAWRRLLMLSKVYDTASSFPTAVKALARALGMPIELVSRPPLDSEPTEVVNKIRSIVLEVDLHLF